MPAPECPKTPVMPKILLSGSLNLIRRRINPCRLPLLPMILTGLMKPKKIRRKDFSDYEAFKAAHAISSSTILQNILTKCGVERDVADEACRLVEYHETGGDPRTDLLKDADSISFFEVNLPLYYQREDPAETRRRCVWGYQRLSSRMKKVAQSMTYEDYELTLLFRKAIGESSTKINFDDFVKYPYPFSR